MDRKKWSLGYMTGVRKRKSFKAGAKILHFDKKNYEGKFFGTWMNCLQ